ncbi:hypothetical protein [Glycomyces buryatensis]|uniref:Uncharacterized protein n=1 Tax=Glycomyces buryatensis TaxID=2570927 RepID=A0A4S8Q733_9ACTN|nr:hypothetical protein [Glycomyces buryatensis]THV40187.1 hypothetical protein FAB82_15955 [Glycomyces buryatensis]
MAVDFFDVVVVAQTTTQPEFAGRRGVALGVTDVGRYWAVYIEDIGEAVVFPELELEPTGERTSQEEFYSGDSITVAVDEQGRGTVTAVHIAEDDLGLRDAETETEAVAAVEAASAVLSRALQGVKQFAEGQGMDHWARYFTAPHDILHGRNDAALDEMGDLGDWIDQLPRERRTTEALRLYAAASRARTAFGGMGSWLDQWFPDDAAHEDYRRFTDELFTAINAARSAALNPGLEPPQRG